MPVINEHTPEEPKDDDKEAQTTGQAIESSLEQILYSVTQSPPSDCGTCEQTSIPYS